jgi:predicted nuclease with TOPRIM domain
MKHIKNKDSCSSAFPITFLIFLGNCCIGMKKQFGIMKKQIGDMKKKYTKEVAELKEDSRKKDRQIAELMRKYAELSEDAKKKEKQISDIVANFLSSNTIHFNPQGHF